MPKWARWRWASEVGHIVAYTKPKWLDEYKECATWEADWRDVAGDRFVFFSASKYYTTSQRRASLRRIVAPKRKGKK